MAKEIRYSDPAVDWETRAYWEGAARGELVLQRCTGCGVVQHRPRAQCAKCLSPEIEHFAASGRGTIHTYTVTHQNLLPPFARSQLYRYPKLTLADLSRSQLVNCFWTALNFFNAAPDDSYLDYRAVVASLERDHFIVHDNLQLGDVVAFADRGGELYHAAVWLADGLVFGKNGESALSPWTILPLEALRGYYPERAEGASILYYRRRGL